MKSSIPSTNPRSTFRPKYALLPSVPTVNSASKSSGNAGAGFSASDIVGAYGRPAHRGRPRRHRVRAAVATTATNENQQDSEAVDRYDNLAEALCQALC